MTNTPLQVEGITTLLDQWTEGEYIHPLLLAMRSVIQDINDRWVKVANIRTIQKCHSNYEWIELKEIKV